MSTCPDDGLHHLFADGEIPAEHISAYKLHLDSCPECREKFMGIGALKNRLRADSEAMGLSAEDIDASFGRLMTKMRFHAVSREIQKNGTAHITRRVLPWAAVFIITVSGVYAFLKSGESAPVEPVTVARQPQAVYNPAPAEIAIPEWSLTRRPLVQAVYNPMSDTQANDTVYISDADVFRPSFVYASASGSRRVARVVMMLTLEGFWGGCQQQQRGEISAITETRRGSAQQIED